MIRERTTAYGVRPSVLRARNTALVSSAALSVAALEVETDRRMKNEAMRKGATPRGGSDQNRQPNALQCSLDPWIVFTSQDIGMADRPPPPHRDTLPTNDESLRAFDFGYGAGRGEYG